MTAHRPVPPDASAPSGEAVPPLHPSAPPAVEAPGREPSWVERLLARVLPSSARRAAVALGVSVGLGVLVIAALGKRRLALGMRLAPQSYPDLIVGNVTWSAVYKDFDQYLSLGLLGMFFGLYLLATVWLNRRRSPGLEDAPAKRSRVPVAFALWGGVAAYTAAAATLSRASHRQEFLATAGLGLSVLASHLWMWRTRGAAHLTAFSRRYMAALVAALGAFFSLLGAVVALRFFEPGWLEAEANALPGVVLPPLLLLATVLAVALDERLSARGWRRLALGAQALSPLLILHVGYGLYQQGETRLRLNVPAGTRALVLGLAVLGIAFVLARAWRGNGAEDAEGPTPASLLAWPTVVAVAFYLAFAPLPWSALATADDFHYGELLVPWQQVMGLGQELYFGFVSIQWWLGLLYGAFNRFLFEGTAASFPHANSLLPVLVAGLNAGLLYRRVGAGWALVISVAALPLSDRQYLMLPILLLLVEPALLARPAAWLASWGGLSVAHAFFNPSTGVALGVALSPVAGAMVLRVVRHWPRATVRWRWSLLAGLAVGAGVLALLARPLYGLLLFTVENGAANATAYGISLTQHGTVPDWFPSRSRLLWEGLRIGGWLIGAVVLWALFSRAQARAEVPPEERDPARVLCLGSMAFLVLMMPYSMGRIDPGFLSRPGTMSFMAIGGLIPCALVLDARRTGSVLSVFLTVGALLGMRMGLNNLEPLHMLVRPQMPVYVPGDAVWVEGRDLGLPNLGRIFAPASKLQEIQHLDGVLGSLLEPGETYYDLSNRSSYYYYLGRRVPAHYVSDYTAVGARVQQRVLATLQHEPPPVVWLGPGYRFDGGPASLRSYRVYRWLLGQGYRYHAQGGLEFLLRPDRFAARVPAGGDAQAEAEGLARNFNPEDVEGIPTAWGRSWKRLSPLFAPETLPLGTPALSGVEQTADGWLRVSGGKAQLRWTLPRPLSGREFDFLRVEFSCRAPVDPWPAGRVSWASEKAPFAPERSLRLGLGDGPLLVPLASHPDWLLGEGLRELRLDVEGREGCASFRVSQPELLHFQG